MKHRLCGEVERSTGTESKEPKRVPPMTGSMTPEESGPSPGLGVSPVQ